MVAPLKLTITAGDHRLEVRISQCRASGVYRDVSADTTLDLVEVPVAEIGVACPGLLDYMKQEDRTK